MNLEIMYYVAAGSAVFTILVIILAIIKTNKELKQNKNSNSIEQLTNDKEDCKVKIEKENKDCKEKCEQDKNEKDRSVLIYDNEVVKVIGISIMVLSGVSFLGSIFESGDSNSDIVAGLSISAVILGLIIYALGQIISLLIKLVNQNTIIYNEIENEIKQEKSDTDL